MPQISKEPRPHASLRPGVLGAGLALPRQRRPTARVRMQAFREEAERSHHSCLLLDESRPMLTRERAIPVHEPVCSPGPPAAGPGVAMFASVTQVAMETMIPRTSSVMAPDLAELLRRGLIFRVGGGGRGGPGRSERQGRFPCR